MERSRRSWVRGAVVLGLSGTMMAAALMSPALAVRLATTSYVKAKVNQATAQLTGQINGVASRVSAVEGVNALQYHRSATVAVPDGGFGQVQAVCPAGTFATGGGSLTSSTDSVTLDTYPSSGGAVISGFYPHGRTGWAIDVQDLGTTGTPSNIAAYVICQAVDATGGNYTAGGAPFASPTARTAG